MGIQIDWADEAKTAILEEFEGAWTWEEFYTVNQQIFDMIHSVNHTVHIIADLRRSGSLPPGKAITHAGKVLGKMPDNWGLQIVINNALLIDILVSVFTKTFQTDLGKRLVPVKTIDEAWQAVSAYAAKAETI